MIRLSRLTPARITTTALLLVLAGCADPRLDELRAYADQVMSRPGGIIEPLPEFRIVGNYLYRSADEGLRDPFEPFIEKEKKEPAAVVTRDPQQEAYEFEVKVRPKEELESYELDSLRMVGTMQDDGSQWGIVVDPTGTVHRVEIGNHMGRNSGKVTAIEEGRIDLREIVGDAESGYDERDAAIALPGET